MNKPLLIGITGGTGSGKSTVSKKILKSIHEKNVAIIEQDSYYKNQSHLSYEERVNTNYDHPFAFDNDLLVKLNSFLLLLKIGILNGSAILL